MEHFVTLSRCPDHFTIPAEFSDRLAFDPSTRRLAFRGFMSKADFDRLSRLSEDWSYRRSLEDLFRLCMPEPPRKPVLARLMGAFGA